MSKKFDLILIDLLPAGLFADYLSLSALMDGTIFIVRNNFTPINQLDPLKKFDIENSYLILNDLKEQRQAQHY